MTRYEHTQQAKVLRALLLWAAVAAVLLAFVVPVPPAVLGLIAAILVGCAVVFSSLTVQVTDRLLAWLYNVSGFGAVLVTRANGKSFLLGSDEPEWLRLAIPEGISVRRAGRGAT